MDVGWVSHWPVRALCIRARLYFQFLSKHRQSWSFNTCSRVTVSWYVALQPCANHWVRLYTYWGTRVEQRLRDCATRYKMAARTTSSDHEGQTRLDLVPNVIERSVRLIQTRVGEESGSTVQWPWCPTVSGLCHGIIGPPTYFWSSQTEHYGGTNIPDRHLW